MTAEGFLQRLRSGRFVNCTYRRDALAGLVQAWRLEERYILTWEECRDGDQLNENAYTRDERKEFSTPEAVLDFVQQQGFQAADFTP